MVLDKLKKYEEGHTIEFDSFHHTYAINGSFFAGVSSVVDEKDKSFLAAWYAKEAVKFLGYEQPDSFIEDIMRKINGMTSIEFRELLETAKGSAVRIGNAAKLSGSLAHEYIEKHINKLNPILPDNEDAHRAINSFLEWEAQRSPEWITTEKLVFSLKHQFAGTLDGLCYLDGKFTLTDLKTSKSVSETYALQTAAYDICLTEAGIPSEQRVIIRIPKDGTKVEECKIATDLEFDKETFLHLREVRRWNTYISSSFTSKKGKYNEVHIGYKNETNN